METRCDVPLGLQRIEHEIVYSPYMRSLISFGGYPAIANDEERRAVGESEACPLYALTVGDLQQSVAAYHHHCHHHPKSQDVDHPHPVTSHVGAPSGTGGDDQEESEEDGRTLLPPLWKPIVSAVMPRSRRGHVMVPVDDLLFVIGGSYWSPVDANATTDMEFNFSSLTWSQLEGVAPPRCQAGSVISPVRSPPYQTAAQRRQQEQEALLLGGGGSSGSAASSSSRSGSSGEVVVYLFGGFAETGEATNTLFRVWLPSMVREQIRVPGRCPLPQHDTLLVADMVKEVSPRERRNEQAESVGRLFLVDGVLSDETGRAQSSDRRRQLWMLDFAVHVWREVSLAPDLLRPQIVDVHYDTTPNHMEEECKLAAAGQTSAQRRRRLQKQQKGLVGGGGGTHVDPLTTAAGTVTTSTTTSRRTYAVRDFTILCGKRRLPTSGGTIVDNSLLFRFDTKSLLWDTANTFELRLSSRYWANSITLLPPNAGLRDDCCNGGKSNRSEWATIGTFACQLPADTLVAEEEEARNNNQRETHSSSSSTATSTASAAKKQNRVSHRLVILARRTLSLREIAARSIHTMNVRVPSAPPLSATVLPHDDLLDELFS